MEKMLVITRHRFEPQELRVTRGETITIRNESRENHTVTADDGIFDSDIIGPTEEIIMEIPDDIPLGVNTYHCSIMEDMKGVIVVRESKDETRNNLA
ncbi:MAG TPA: cupredoxin domain-containing protein [Patescibacteria group bacterium]